MSFCRACGASLSPGTSFCAHCGAAAPTVRMIDTAPAPAPGAPAAAQPTGASAPLTREARQRIALAVGAVAAALAARVGQFAALILGLAAFPPFGRLGLVSLLPGIAIGLVLIVGLHRRRRWARIAAMVFGGVRVLSMLATVARLSFVSPMTGLAFAALELVAIGVAGYVLLRPGAKGIWSL